MKKKEDSLKTCFTFESAPTIVIKQEGVELKLLDQRKSVQLFVKPGALFLVDLNIKLMDIIVGEEYKNQKVLFTRELFGAVDLPAETEFLAFFGADADQRDPTLKIINANPKRNFEEKVRPLVRRDKKLGVRVTSVVISKEFNLALVLFEDFCLKILRGTHLYHQDDLRDFDYPLTIRPTELFIQDYSASAGVFNLLYTTGTGIFLADKLRPDAFDRQRSGDSLYTGSLMQSFFSETFNDLYFLETRDEELCLSVLSIARRERRLSITLSGTVHTLCRYREFLLLFRSTVSSKNALSKQPAVRNQLEIYDLQNEYVCFKSTKGDVRVFSVAPCNGDFYLVIQSQPGGEAKELGERAKAFAVARFDPATAARRAAARLDAISGGS